MKGKLTFLSNERKKKHHRDLTDVVVICVLL